MELVRQQRLARCKPITSTLANVFPTRTVGVPVLRSTKYQPDELLRICQTWALDGIGAMYDAGVSKPFRLLYMSAWGIERDPTKAPPVFTSYLRMRGETETQIMAFAAAHKGEIEASVTRSGFIVRSGINMLVNWIPGFRVMSVGEIAAAMLDQVVNGFEGDPLYHDDLVRIGKRVLQAQKE